MENDTYTCMLLPILGLTVNYNTDGIIKMIKKTLVLWTYSTSLYSKLSEMFTFSLYKVFRSCYGWYDFETKLMHYFRHQA